MTLIIVVMCAALVIALITAGVVVMGMQGRGHRSAPKLVDSMAKAARHLNGEAKRPPRVLTRLLQ